jgi:hypothetical protein
MRVHDVLAIACVAIAACGGEDQATDAEYQEIAEQISGLGTDPSAGDLVLLREIVGAGLGETPAGLDVDLEGRIIGHRGDIDLEINFECRDVANEQSFCGASAAEASFSLEIEGDLQLPRYRTHFERTAEWQVNGLQEANVMVDGTSTLHTVAEHRSFDEDDDDFRITELDVIAQYNGVGVRRTDRALVEGTIEYSIDLKRLTSDADRDIDREIESTGRLEISGPGQAVLTLDSSRRFEVDVDSGTIIALPEQEQ